MSISAFFDKTLGAKLANTRWSWGATNSASQLFLRVWADQLQTVGGIERIHILRTTWEGTSPGFPERKRHIELLKNGTEAFGVLCTPKEGPKHGSREIANFDQEHLLQFGQLIEEADRTYAEVISRIPVEALARSKTSYSAIVPDLKSIFAQRNGTTNREVLANARVGQGMFRTEVIKMWGSQCCVTGTNTLDAIRESHIKPWRDSTNHERLDPSNGLPLVATLDALFDAGLVSFANDGRLLVAKRLATYERERLGLLEQRLAKPPSEQTNAYLKYHRDKIFLGT